MLEKLDERIKKIENLLNLSFNNLEILSKYAESGVIFLSTDGVIINDNAKIGKGTKIYPGTIIEGETTIGENCEIGPNVVIKSTTMDNGCKVNNSEINNSKIDEKSKIKSSLLKDAVIMGNTYIYDSNVNKTEISHNTEIISSKLLQCEIMDNVSIGPYSNIRPNSIIKSYAHIGDFVEIKNSVIGEHTSISHLTYIGDSIVGENVNVGCGCVTVNYSGTQKSGCTIEDNAFIGCHTVMVAPVKIGKGAYTAANTTVVEDIPPAALAIGRVRPEIKENWAKEKYKK